ncbi:hypothetical protein J4209_04615 [Candidatus Woesearchaeota archaeon]|nr:hypothetical protein [Candidatus Woesearchaeota archaeon]
MWGTIFALASLMLVVFLIAPSDGDITGAAVFKGKLEGSYGLSLIFIFSMFILAFYMEFVQGKNKINLSPKNIEKTLDEKINKVEKKLKKYL